MDGITTSINSILKNLIKNFNTLLDCPVRFSGEYDAQKIHNFIEYIESYKRIKCITDEQALRELQYLLLDQANAWWLRRKSNLITWSEALTSLENNYSKQRPAHIIYREIFKLSYDDYKTKEDFIDDKNELLNEIQEPKLNEKNKLEMIYALLPNVIQKKLKFIDILNLRDFKEQLNNLKCDNDDDDNGEDGVTQTETTVQTKEACKELQQQPSQNPESSSAVVASTDTTEDDDRDPVVIKVRRTEDLMPQVKDEDEENTTQDEEFISNVSSTNNGNCNNNSHNSNDNFQIDLDIMNQINNIIDESEMNMDTSTSSTTINHSQHIPTLISGRPPPPDSAAAIAFILNNENILASEFLTQKPSESQNKISNATKKAKIRCSFCRKFNHTSQTCLKKAKQMKLFPEKFMTPITAKLADDAPSQIFIADTESFTSNHHKNTPLSSTNSAESSLNTTTSHSLQNNSMSTTLISSSSSITTPPLVNNVVHSSTFNNNIPEKSNNSTLSTKLIAPINGPTSNKLTAAKLRGSSGPMPKCHQCGTVGFYKSICPNCSPIYNNNNHYKQ